MIFIQIQMFAFLTPKQQSQLPCQKSQQMKTFSSSNELLSSQETEKSIKKELFHDLSGQDISTDCYSPLPTALKQDSFSSINLTQSMQFYNLNQSCEEKPTENLSVDKCLDFYSFSCGEIVLQQTNDDQQSVNLQQKPQDVQVKLFNQKIAQQRKAIHQKIEFLHQKIQQMRLCESATQQSANTYVNTLEQRMLILKQKHILPIYNKLQQNQQDLEEMQKQLHFMNYSYQRLLKQLHNVSKTQLVGSIGNILQKQLQNTIEEIQNFGIVNQKVQNKNKQMIYPQAQTKQFNISNYDQIKESKHEIITDQFETKHNRWRMKIYPSGYISEKSAPVMRQVQYLSIYIEMLDGVLQSNDFSIKVELINKNNPQKNICKQFKSNFHKNQSWGYDRYTRVANLYRKGFVTQQNSIIVRVSIRHLNHCQTSKVLQYLINKKQQISSINQNKIKLLKAKLSLLQSKKSQNQKKQSSTQKMLKHQIIRLQQISLENNFPSKVIRLATSRNTNLINSHRQKTNFF